MAQFDTINLAQIYGAADDANFRRAQMENFNKKAMREQQAYDMEEKLKGAYAIGEDGALDEKTTLANLYRVDPMAASKFKQDIDAGALAKEESAVKKRKGELENKVATAKYFRDRLATVQDQPSYEAVYQEAMTIDPNLVQGAPREFNPEWVRGQVLDADKYLTQMTPKYEKVELGGKVQIIDMNPYTNPSIKGTSFDKTLTPGEKASGERADRQYRLEKDKFTYTKENDAAASTPAGSGAGEGGGKPVKLTEGERKSATLLTRMEGSLAQMDDVLNKNPSAAKPELLSSGVRGLTFGTQEALANTLTSSDRQRIDSAQLDFLDAALTLGTGAAYTKEQLEGYRKSYFPQLGDSDAQVKDKAARRAKIIEAARIAAGNASDSVPKPTPSAPTSPAVPKPGTVVDGYIFNGGNPADPKSWKKK
jgi:hypothetical protein